MNLVVNQQGVLQFMGPKQEEEFMYNQQQPVYNSTQQHAYNPNIKKVQYQEEYHVPQQNKNSLPLDPALKHSYIYNKYFKDYSDAGDNKPNPRVPKTIEEYKQMLLNDRIIAIQQKKRIEQIKSKKMLFVVANGVHSNPRNMQATKNNLRSMSFR